MLTQSFLTINDWITGATALAALGCFLWGMVSVLLSPCHLASIPLVEAYVAGQEQVLKHGRPPITPSFINTTTISFILFFLMASM